MNRLRAKAGNALLAAVVVLSSLLCARPSTAQDVAEAAAGAPVEYWFAGTRLVFERPQVQSGRVAVGTGDTGLVRFLARLGAAISYQPGQGYIVVTSGDRRTITFTIGDAAYDVSGVGHVAAFAPYVAQGVAYLPFAELARSLDVLPVDDGTGTTVLQPQLSALDVRPLSRATLVTLRGATPLHFKRLTSDGDDHLVLAFTGIGTTLERNRALSAGPLGSVTIRMSGTPRNPTTTVDFTMTPGAGHALVSSFSPNAVALAFGPPGVELGGTPVPRADDPTLATLPVAPRDAPPPPPIPAVSAAVPAAATEPDPATVTDVTVEPGDASATISVAITGALTYEWHRLPDNRWYVDLKPATLAMDAQTLPVADDAVQSLRIKGFVGPLDRRPTVRIAMTLATPRVVDLSATRTGLAIAVDRLDDLAPQKVGLGELTGGRLIASAVPLAQTTPVPALPDPDASPPLGVPSDWKYAPAAPAGVNSRLIVIDPGHGGSDRGAMHHDLTEALINLDISKRLRSMLVARGWIVKMTRDTDVDVFAPNDSAHDELQARCDVANAAGARLFISVHTNSFTTGELNGTTTYYYKGDSYGLAHAVHAQLAANLPTQDDGIRKENFYVIHHTSAPAILVETAFLSNAADARLLKSDAFLTKVASSIAAGVGDYASGGN